MTYAASAPGPEYAVEPPLPDTRLLRLPTSRSKHAFPVLDRYRRQLCVATEAAWVLGSVSVELPFVR